MYNNTRQPPTDRRTINNEAHTAQPPTSNGEPTASPHTIKNLQRALSRQQRENSTIPFGRPLLIGLGPSGTSLFILLRTMYNVPLHVILGCLSFSAFRRCNLPVSPGPTDMISAIYFTTLFFLSCSLSFFSFSHSGYARTTARRFSDKAQSCTLRHNKQKNIRQQHPIDRQRKTTKTIRKIEWGLNQEDPLTKTDDLRIGYDRQEQCIFFSLLNVVLPSIYI
jgi:hypothetical protein